MTSFGDLLTTALAERPTRGQVYWIANTTWQIALYDRAQASHHPGLICSTRPTLAPGTSKRRAGRGSFGSPFVLKHPDSLNGPASSTFFLEFRKYVPTDDFGRFIGRIHDDDLRRLNQILDAESEAPHEAN